MYLKLTAKKELNHSKISQRVVVILIRYGIFKRKNKLFMYDSCQASTMEQKSLLKVTLKVDE